MVPEEVRSRKCGGSEVRAFCPHASRCIESAKRAFATREIEYLDETAVGTAQCTQKLRMYRTYIFVVLFKSPQQYLVPAVARIFLAGSRLHSRAIRSRYGHVPGQVAAMFGQKRVQEQANQVEL